MGLGDRQEGWNIQSACLDIAAGKERTAACSIEKVAIKCKTQ